MWKLTVRSPDSKPYDYSVKPKINTIGRRSNNDIIISDEASSSHHAQIELDPQSNGLSIRDLGSKNGTFINRHRLTPEIDFALNSHDTIRIGSCDMLVHFNNGSESKLEMEATGFQTFSR